jgi:HEAT repeat protein
MSLFGPPNVGKMEAKRDVNGLIKALGNEPVCEDAAKALGRLKAQESVEPLIDRLNYGSEAAATALGMIKDPRSVEPLIRTLITHKNKAAVVSLVQFSTVAIKALIISVLNEKNNDNRKEIVGVLVKINDPQCIDMLISALKESDEYVRKNAAEVLDELGWKQTKDESGASYWIVKRNWDKCIEIGACAVEPLIAALTDWDVNDAVMKALCEIGAPAVDQLIATLKVVGERGLVRWLAVEALGKIGDARAVDPLIAALKDEDSNVRKNAAEALGKIGNARVVDPLIAALKDENRDVQKNAVEALGKIGDARAVEPLITALENEKVLRKASAIALVNIYKTVPIDNINKSLIL